MAPLCDLPQNISVTKNDLFVLTSSWEQCIPSHIFLHEKLQKNRTSYQLCLPCKWYFDCDSKTVKYHQLIFCFVSQSDMIFMNHEKSKI